MIAAVALELTVRDHGPGAGVETRVRPGVGLANTRSRLQHLYGERHRFEAATAPGGGWEARIEIPFRTSAQA